MSNFLINNRWQFFYRQSDDYSDDKRIIGELPMLYDDKHLKYMQEKIGIQVSFIKRSISSIESFEHGITANPTMLFINKMDFMTRPFNQMRRCVSTIIANRLKENLFCCHTFDQDLDSIQLIDAKTLYHSWVCASDYEQLNQCNISITFPLDYIAELSLINFSKDCMKTSLSSYLSKNNTESVFYGCDGMKKFSDDILNWNAEDFQKLVDCAMYIDVFVKQRIFFICTLKELSIKNKDSIFKKLDTLMEDWNKLKMYIYIIGMRKQSDVRKRLSNWVSKLSNLEFDVASGILDALQ